MHRHYIIVILVSLEIIRTGSTLLFGIPMKENGSAKFKITNPEKNLRVILEDLSFLSFGLKYYCTILWLNGTDR